MARPQAKIKKGFYKFPPHLIKYVAAWLNLQSPLETAILDPCAGEGELLSVLGNTLCIPNENLYANELDYERYLLCKQKFQNVVCGDAISELGCERFSLAFVNPPYDNDAFSEGRLEAGFLKRARRWLRHDGILIFVVPLYILPNLKSFPVYFKDIRILKFPEPDFTVFKQAVVLARYDSKDSKKENDSWAAQLANPGCLTDSPIPYHVPRTRFSGMEPFRTKNLTDDVFEAIGKRSEIKKLSALGMKAVCKNMVTTLMPMSAGHQALMLATGLLDGVYRNPDDGNILAIVGKTESVTIKQALDPEIDDNVVSREIITHKPCVMAWDLTESEKTGDIVLYELE